VLPRGQDQARGKTSNFINRAFGRVSLRGVSRVRHAAFKAAAGSKQHTAFHSSSALNKRAGGRGHVGVEWRWGSGSGRVHLPGAHAGVVRSRAGS